MNFIWASRGRDWGSCFLRDGGTEKPLIAYKQAFDDDLHSTELFTRSGGLTAVRFPDPEGRADRAGRVILHEFVLFDGADADIGSVGEARVKLWPQVADEFSSVWLEPRPPEGSRR